MQVSDVSAVRTTSTLPTDFAGSAPAAGDAAQAQAAKTPATPNQTPPPTVLGDIISLSPAAALLCGSAMAP